MRARRPELVVEGRLRAAAKEGMKMLGMKKPRPCRKIAVAKRWKWGGLAKGRRAWRAAGRPQVRRAAPAVFAQRRRHLTDAGSAEGRLDDHFAGEFHAGGLQVQVEHGLAVETAQSAMKVLDGRAKQHASDPGQHGVAEILV